MKLKTNLLNVLLICILFTIKANAQVHSNCPAAPYSIDVSQPDGSFLTIIGKGNSLLSYTETIDGYTLLKNQSTGFYEYALPDNNGDLKFSGVKASNKAVRSFSESAFLNNVPTHLTYSTEMAELKKGEAIADQKKNMRSSAVAAKFPTKGNRKALVLLIQYPDMMGTFSKEDFEKLMNEPNYKGTGSFKDFYIASSFGQLTVTSDVVGWYTAKNPSSSYGNDKGKGVAAGLVAEAIDAANKEGVDFSKYDNDKDGKVDGIIVVHAGPGAEIGGQNQYIWSHRGSVQGKNSDGVSISDYMINPEKRGANQTPIGVFCHEFGHGLGLPDLYDTDDANGASEGLGEWCLMAGGPYLGGEALPAGFSAWCKISLGWHTPTVVGNGSYTLYPAANENKSYKYLTSNPNEYFLFESRTKTGVDKALSGEGLAIYKINLAKTTGWGGVNADETNKGVQIYEADGKFDLDNGANRGDNGDLFPGSYNRKVFNDNTTPNAKLESGTSSNLDVNAIKKSTSSITFNIGPAVPPSTSFASNKASGCLTESYTLTENSSGSITAFKWDFGADANPATSFARGPHSVSYSSAGTKNISLITIGPNGNDTLNQNLDVVDVNATGSIDKQSVLINEPINFSAIGNATNWTWTFGDGNTASTQNSAHSYSTAGVYTANLTASTLLCTVTSNYTIVVTETSTAINNLEKTTFSIYPNPSNGLLSVKPKNNSLYKLSITNLLGKVQVQKENVSGESKLDISDMPKGIYFLTVEVNGEKQIHKVVKN